MTGTLDEGDWPDLSGVPSGRSSGLPAVGADQRTLVSGPVTLRPWRLGDASTRLPLYDTEVARLFGRVPDGGARGGAVPAPSRLQEAIRRWHEGDAGGRIASFLVVRTEDPVPVGTCAIEDAGAGVGLVTWTTYAPYRRRGYATRAAEVLCRHGFEDLGLDRLEAHLVPEDTAAMRVCARAGFVREGVLRGKRPRTGDGPRGDVVLHARLASDPVPVRRLRDRFFR